MIELSGVHKRYGALEALRGIDLHVRAGEVVGVLGPNGAGKTTAIALMLGLSRPTSGQVRLLGGAPERSEARARVGVMLQESGVPNALRVRELVRLFQSYCPRTLPTDEIIERADLGPKADALVSTLSGGQKQRLAFALAIAGDPDVLFLDEPTVGLDASARRSFWEQVTGYAGLGKTILFSTHYLNEVERIASRVVVIDQGRVIAEGTPAQIRRRVAETAVRSSSDLPLEGLIGMPHVQHAASENGRLVAYTSEPEALLRLLMEGVVSIKDLRITDTDLETAFVHLTREGEVRA